MDLERQDLFQAVVSKDLGHIRGFVERVGHVQACNVINHHDESGYTLLHTAISTCCLSTDIVRYLLEHDADINQKVQSAKIKANARLQGVLSIATNGVSPLHLAVSTGDANLVKYLLDAGAEIDALDMDRKAPLHCACYHGHTEIVKLLVSNMAGINFQDSSGSTPLHHAAYLLSQGVVIYEFLVCAGADDSIPNQNGQKPSDLIETWFSESEDTPEIRHNDGDETITSYSNLTLTEELPLSSMVAHEPFEDEETDESTLIFENIDLDADEVVAPSSPYSEVSRLTFVSESSVTDAPAQPSVQWSVDNSSTGNPFSAITESSDFISVPEESAESSELLPMAIPHNSFSLLSRISVSVRQNRQSILSMPSNPQMLNQMEPVPLNSARSGILESMRSQDFPASIVSIELPTTSLSLRSHEFFMGMDDGRESLMWSESESSRHGISSRVRACLPTRIYFEQEECVICKCEWKTKEVIKTLPCSHDFHANCIDQWLQISSQCPVCKQPCQGH